MHGIGYSSLEVSFKKIHLLVSNIKNIYFFQLFFFFFLYFITEIIVH